jgi:hypothetical protein
MAQHASCMFEPVFELMELTKKLSSKRPLKEFDLLNVEVGWLKALMRLALTLAA